MQFNISKTWDGSDCGHLPTEINLDCNSEGLVLSVIAKYFGDPAPPGVAGNPCPKLWDYEGENFFVVLNTITYLKYRMSYF